MTTASATHYDVLGIDTDADARAVKRAFYKLLQESPPEQKPKEYQRLREAYDVLSNPVSRREYDNMAAFGEEIEALKEEAEALMHADDPDYKQAIRTLKKAIVLGPEIGILRNMLGLCYMRSEAHSKALQQFGKATEIDPDNQTYWLNKGQAFQATGAFKSAESLFRKVWEHEEEDYEAPRALADLLFEQERTDEAIDVLDQAIEADGKIDFQDFFCLYDKLHVLLFSGRHDELEREIETISSVAVKDEEKRFASFMLARTGAELMDVSAFSLAKRFTDAAEQLDPESEMLGDLAQEAREVDSLIQAADKINEPEAYHPIVQHMVSLHAAVYVGELSQEVYQERFSELIEILDNVMRADPLSSQIKRELRLIKRTHREVFDLNDGFFQAILDLPRAQLFRDECPYCGELILADKSDTGLARCPDCHREIRFDGQQYSKPGSRVSYRSSGQSSGSTTISPSSNSGDCFVATAVYQDAHHPDVLRLRQFRDETLREYALGRAFIGWYYKRGPRLASGVRQVPAVQALVRATLAWFVHRLP